MEEKRLEVEYIISLTILILTFLAVPHLRTLVEPFVAQMFLLIVSLHIVLFNVGYVFRATGFKLAVIQKIEIAGRITLIAVFLAFVYIFLHILCMSLPSISSNSLIPLILPAVIVGALTVGIIQKILKPYLILRNIRVLIAPDKIDIYSKYEDTEPLFVKIENGNKDKDIKAEIKITFPENVLYSVEYDGIYDGKNEFSKKIELSAKRAWIRNISMRYKGSRTERGIIDIKIYINGNSYEKNIEALLKAQ